MDIKQTQALTVQANATIISECTIYRTRAGISIQSNSDTIITHVVSIRTDSVLFLPHPPMSRLATATSTTTAQESISCDSSCITITDSYADTNGIGFLAEQSSHIEISASAARDNDDNEGGMFFEDCQYISIINSFLVHNGVGINLINSSACYIDSCNFSFNTHFSCKLKQSLSSISVKELCVY